MDMIGTVEANTLVVERNLVEPMGGDFQRQISDLMSGPNDEVVIDLTRIRHMITWYVGQLVYAAIEAKVRQKRLRVRVMARTTIMEMIEQARLGHLIQLEAVEPAGDEQ
jgi:anti-anti-sigma regulatory factor